MLRPIDIQNKEFEKKIKGYDVEQVDDFLDAVIHDYEILMKENQKMKDKITLLTESLEHYKIIEATMDNALSVAKDTAQSIRANAEAEAENIIAKAKLDAQRLSKQIDEEHAKKHREMLALKSEIEAQKTRIASICDSIKKMAGDM